MEVTKINTSLGEGVRSADFRPVGYYYCPQTKFAKVMFSQLFVCPRGGLCPEEGGQSGGSLSGGWSMSWGSLYPGGLCPYGKEQVVCILLECILVRQ